MNQPTSITLNNGVQIPQLGFGTYKLKNGEEAEQAIKGALETGYRHIDTAQFYGNEASVAKAIKESDLKREEIFITTKLKNPNHGYDNTLESFEESLKRLDTDYVDLFLVHWPVNKKRLDTWKAFEKIYQEGRAKAIGVSNYTIEHLQELLDNSETIPSINQFELHPFLFQKELITFCMNNKIQVEAYSPLTQGNYLDDELLKKIADKYKKTTAQILIRWSLEHNFVVIPKSSNQGRIAENFNVFDFELEEEDLLKLDQLSRNARVAWNPTDPEEVEKYS